MSCLVNICTSYPIMEISDPWPGVGRGEGCVRGGYIYALRLIFTILANYSIYLTLKKNVNNNTFTNRPLSSFSQTKE